MARKNRSQQVTNTNRSDVNRKLTVLETLNYLAAIISMLLSSISIAWQVSTYVKNKEEKVSTTVSFDNLNNTGKMNIQAEIINLGERPQFIRQVEIVVAPTINYGTILLKSKKTDEEPIEPGARRIFEANDLDVNLYADFARESTDVYLVVNSNKGALHRQSNLKIFFQDAKIYFSPEALKNPPDIVMSEGEAMQLNLEDVLKGDKPIVTGLSTYLEESDTSPWTWVIALTAGILSSLSLSWLTFKIGWLFWRRRATSPRKHT